MERSKKIDILKFLGSILIILAHVCKSNIIIQLRNFDVPLMCLVSGYLSVDSFNKIRSIKSYYKKRIIRLIVPTYIFLTFFFIIVKLLFLNQQYPFSLIKILKTYLLLDGVGYVWIIRVYWLCAIITPLLIYAIKKVPGEILNIIVAIIYIIYELVNYWYGTSLGFIYAYIISNIIPYGVLLYIGMRLKNAKKNEMVRASIISFIFFGLLMVLYYNINGEFISTQGFKYPPTLYYISYALGVSLILFIITDYTWVQDKIYNKFIMFISKNSLWIYLWHILYVYILSLTNITNWIVGYIAVLVVTICTVQVQQIIISYFERKGFNKKILSVFKG